jgi:molybdopterin converting factor subunit 1
VQVYIRLFAGLRERAGASEVSLDLPEGARVADALARLQHVTGNLPVVMAVNQEYADEAMALASGDELALIPPVSGGSIAAAHVRVTDEPLALDPLIERVRDPRAGAVVTFSGVTRDVAQLDYEAYVEMAERKLGQIVETAIEPLSEPSVTVAASAPHRGEAFAGAREIIDEIKAQAPIWKKEEGQWKAGTKPG